jgi:hypothetical protein
LWEKNDTVLIGASHAWIWNRLDRLDAASGWEGRLMVRSVVGGPIVLVGKARKIWGCLVVTRRILDVMRNPYDARRDFQHMVPYRYKVR